MSERPQNSPAIETFQRGLLTIQKTYLADHDYDDDWGHVWSGSRIEIELIQELQRKVLSSLIPPGWILCEDVSSEQGKEPNGFCT